MSDVVRGVFGEVAEAADFVIDVLRGVDFSKLLPVGLENELLLVERVAVAVADDVPASLVAWLISPVPSFVPLTYRPFTAITC